MNKFCSRLLRSQATLSQYSSCIALGRNLSYKSDLSLDVLYPKSNAQFYTPPAPVRSQLNSIAFCQAFIEYILI